MALFGCAQAGWKEIDICVDSGACDSVMPEVGYEGLFTLPSIGSKAGLEYEVASGQHIPNLGEKHCLFSVESSSVTRALVFQVADIHKPLLSVTRTADMGYECMVGKYGGVLIDLETQESIPITRQGNLYSLKGWVMTDPQGPKPEQRQQQPGNTQAGFTRQG